MYQETLPQRFRSLVQSQGDAVAQYSKPQNAKESAFVKTTFRELWQEAQDFGAGLLSLGVSQGAHVGIVSDNRREWMAVDLGVLSIGAADVPRGSDSTKEEIGYILQHSDCLVAVAEDQIQLDKILASIPTKHSIRILIVLDDSLAQHRKAPSSIQMLNFSEVKERGRIELKKNPKVVDAIVDTGKPTDLATLIYTSGTTGEPKGAMLTHQSFLFQREKALERFHFDETDTFLSVLPIWHAFERAVEYIVLTSGASIAYSKPVGKIMLEDMAQIKPTWFVSVPRIWESIRAAVYRNVKTMPALRRGLFHFFVNAAMAHAKLKDEFLHRTPHFTPHWNLPTAIWTALPILVLGPIKALGNVLVFRKLKNLLGGRFVGGISGGGALPPHVDRFFQAIGIMVLEGYGLTEAGPVLAVRNQKAPILGTVGKLLSEVEYKILDEESRTPVPFGHKGELWVRSPQIMLGYYKRPEASAKVLVDGWLNTGDLVLESTHHDIKIIGRSKDTIVLRGGENIEPEPIEQRLLQSEFIDQVIVVGQDQKFLGALIVPQFELLEQFAKDRRIAHIDREDLLDNAQIVEYVHEVVQYLVNPRTGFKPFERIYQFKLLPKAFEVGKEMTASLKLKRNVIAELFQNEIRALFDRSKDE